MTILNWFKSKISNTPNVPDISAERKLPKSYDKIERLSSTGKKLIIFAWIIEIIIALVSFSISISLVLRGKQQAADVEGAIIEKIGFKFLGINVPDVDMAIIGLCFFVIGIIELTKIPLVITLYNAASRLFKLLFIIALIAVNILTIETILQGLRTAYSSNSQAVELERQNLKSIDDRIASLDENKEGIDNQVNINIDRINSLKAQIAQQRKNIEDFKIKAIRDIEELRKELSSANPKIKKLEEKISEEKEKLKNIDDEKRNALSNPEIVQLEKQKNLEISKLEKLRNENIQLKADLNELLKKFGKGTAKKNLRTNIENNQSEINVTQSKIDEIDNKIDTKIANLNEDLNSKSKAIIESIEKLEEQLNSLIGLTSASIQDSINAINTERDSNITIANNIIKDLNEQISTLEADKPKYQSNKGENKTYLEDRNLLIEERNIQVEKVRKISNSNQIYNLALTIKLNPFIRWVSGGEVPENFGAEDLTTKDVERAFWLLYGLLAIIISIIGTLIAAAGVHLQDRDVHIRKNKKYMSKLTLGYSLRKLIVRMSRYFTKPKTIEKIIEKEIEVEKIIEKPVIEEKIVYQKIEVPKETVKRELVHVPLWTQDPSLISKKIDISEVQDKPKKKK